MEKYIGEPIGRAPEKYRHFLSKMREYGYGMKKRKRTGKEIAEATISSLKDIELADKEYDIVQNLIQKEKEGGIILNE